MVWIFVEVMLFVTTVSALHPPVFELNMTSSSTINISCTFDESSPTSTLFQRRIGENFETVLKVRDISGECYEHTEISLADVMCICTSGKSVSCCISVDNISRVENEWRCAKFNADKTLNYSNKLIVHTDDELPVPPIILTALSDKNTNASSGFTEKQTIVLVCLIATVVAIGVAVILIALFCKRKTNAGSENDNDQLRLTD